MRFSHRRNTKLCRQAAQHYALRLKVLTEGEITGVQPPLAPCNKARWQLLLRMLSNCKYLTSLFTLLRLPQAVVTTR